MATQFRVEDDDILPIAEPEPSIVETEDGGAVVDFEPPAEDQTPDIVQAQWGDNLAEFLDDTALNSIGGEVCEAVKIDDASREEWKKVIKEGMDLLGFVSMPRSTPFEGACGVVYPMITEAAIKFQARAYVEMCPDGGPVDAIVLGAETKETTDQAERVRDFMNWHCTEKDEAYYPDYDQMLLWLPILGSVFRKIWYDPAADLVTSRYVHPDDLIVSYGASDIDTAPRVTQELRYTANELRRLQIAGFYRDVELVPVTQHADPGPLSEKADEIEGVEPSQADPTARRKLYEVHTELDLEADPVERPEGLKLPYVVTIDEESQVVLSIRRSWKEGDPRFKRRSYFVHYRYLPGLGCYGYGLLHVAGGLARAATSLLRQLVDAGQFANLPGGLKAKGVKAEQNTTPIAPGEWREIDVMDPTRPVSNLFAPLPYKEPSAALLQMMNGIIESGQRLTSTTDAEVGDGSSQQPVGTVLALIENAVQIQSAVHKRMHQAQRKEFRLMAELHAEHAPQEGYPFNVVGGDRKVMAKDFDQRIDIVPVSDPKSFTATQRIAKAQYEMQVASQAPPGMFNIKEVFKRNLRRAGIDDAEAIMSPDPPEPYTGDPNSENMAAAMGKPLKVRPDQDHDAHCTAHLLMLQVPGMMMSPAGQILLRHAVDHDLWGIWAEQAAKAQQAQPSPEVAAQMQAMGVQPQPLQFPMPGQPMDPAMENIYAKATAEAMRRVVDKLKAMVAMPPGQQDPAMVQAQTNAEDVKLQDERERIKIALDAKNKAEALAVKERENADRMALEYEKLTAGAEQRQIELEATAREAAMGRLTTLATRPQPMQQPRPQ